MQLRAKVTNHEAAAEIRNWLENQGYRVTTQRVEGVYSIYTDLPALIPQKKQKHKVSKPSAAKNRTGRIANVWTYVVISTIIALLFLKLL